MLSLYNVNARHVVVPNAVVGMAVFCGGLAQLLAGMWEFPNGNMFGATGMLLRFHELGLPFRDATRPISFSFFIFTLC